MTRTEPVRVSPYRDTHDHRPIRRDDDVHGHRDADQLGGDALLRHRGPASAPGPGRGHVRLQGRPAGHGGVPVPVPLRPDRRQRDPRLRARRGRAAGADRQLRPAPRGHVHRGPGAGPGDGRARVRRRRPGGPDRQRDDRVSPGRPRCYLPPPALGAVMSAARTTGAVPEVTRAQALAYRVVAQQLDRAGYCRSCGTVHISDQLMRLAALPAGLAVDQSTTPLTLRPIPNWDGVPEAQAGASHLVRAYLRLHGPATPKEVAAYLQTTQAAVKGAWPAADELAELRVDGRTAWVPADRLDALRDAPEPEVVRLLPRSD